MAISPLPPLRVISDHKGTKRQVVIIYKERHNELSREEIALLSEAPVQNLAIYQARLQVLLIGFFFLLSFLLITKIERICIDCTFSLEEICSTLVFLLAGKRVCKY